MEKLVAGTRKIPNGKTQVNFNISDEMLEQVKNLAYWENVTQSDVYNSSVAKFIKAFEKKNGKIRPIPTRKGFDNL